MHYLRNIEIKIKTKIKQTWGLTEIATQKFWSKRNPPVKVLMETNINISDDFFSHVHRSVNFTGSEGKFTWTPSWFILCTRHNEAYTSICLLKSFLYSIITSYQWHHEEEYLFVFHNSMTTYTNKYIYVPIHWHMYILVCVCCHGIVNK